VLRVASVDEVGDEIVRTDRFNASAPMHLQMARFGTHGTYERGCDALGGRWTALPRGHSNRG
jgi:hypothetical protein